MDVLTEALKIATQVHADQIDKAGAPYLMHILAVAGKVTEATAGWDAQEREITVCIALLHDALEDTTGRKHIDTRTRIARINHEVCEAVLALTKRHGETYTGYLLRVGQNHRARIVKVADLEHNMDLTRLGRTVTDSDRARQAKYAQAHELLVAIEGLH